jgi:hypothetical protein
MSTGGGRAVVLAPDHAGERWSDQTGLKIARAGAKPGSALIDDPKAHVLAIDEIRVYWGSRGTFTHQ